MISFPLTLPSLPQARVLTWMAQSQTAATESPFTGSQQVQAFQNDRLSPSIELPGGMARDDIAPFVGALNAQRGGAGACFFGEYAGRTPRGAAKNYVPGGSVNPVVYDPAAALVAGSRLLAMTGWPINIANLMLEGDWLQVGNGWNAVRIKTAGGSSTLKYVLTLLGGAASTNGQLYSTRLRVRNKSATKTLRIHDNLGAQVDVAPGVEQQVQMLTAGDGVSFYQVVFRALAAGDALDFVVWDLVASRYGYDENLAPATALDFVTGWTALNGAVITTTANQNQRMYQVTAPCSTDANGIVVADIYPRLREAPAAGDAITWLNTAGVFRLTPDSNGGTTWTIDQALQYGLKFQLTEAF
jgi:hypothetical protein